MGILNILASGNYIPVNRYIVKQIGLEEAILLGELASEHTYYESEDKLEDGYFFSTVENIEEKTTLSPYKQRTAIENLKQLGILEVKVKDIPPKRYFKLNEESIYAKFNIKKLKNLSFISEDFLHSKVKKLNTNKNINKENISKENINNKYIYIRDIYNSICTNLPKVKVITDKRKTQINKFLKEFTIEQFEEICKKANESDFLIGNNDRGWTASLDFLLRTDKAVNILESEMYQTKKGKKDGGPIKNGGLSKSVYDIFGSN